MAMNRSPSISGMKLPDVVMREKRDKNRVVTLPSNHEFRGQRACSQILQGIVDPAALSAGWWRRPATVLVLACHDGVVDSSGSAARSRMAARRW